MHWLKREEEEEAQRISPEFNVDDMIFNKLILGYDYLDDVDFSDIYSVVKVIAELIYKKR